MEMELMELPSLQVLMSLLIYVVVAMLGTIGHTVKKLVELEKEGRFNINSWAKKNKFALIYGAFISLAGVFTLYEVGQLNMVSAFLVSFAGESLRKGREESKENVAKAK